MVLDEKQEDTKIERASAGLRAAGARSPPQVRGLFFVRHDVVLPRYVQTPSPLGACFAPKREQRPCGNYGNMYRVFSPDLFRRS